jgi:hypothetical protein
MGMKILRTDIDTSVIGGCFDTESSPWSNGLMQDFRRGHFRPTPEPVRVQYAELLSLGAEVLAVNDEPLDLAAVYEAHSILASRFRNDLLHIALATVADVDVLVSWNFRHVVRLEKIRLCNAVNLERGYKPIQIYSPREVTTYDPDEPQSR